jgi:methyl-accepting chemotaxis protein
MSKLLQIYDRFFINPYRSKDIRILKKAGILAPTALIVCALTVLLGAIMALTGAVAVAGILSGLFVFCLVVLLFMSKGYYETASSIFLYGLLVVMFAAIKFDAYQDVYETYVFASLGLFFMILVGLVGARRFHAIIAMLGTLAGIFVIYAMDALPKDGGVVTLLAVQNLATCTVIVVAGGLITGMTIRMQNTLVDETRKTADHAREQFERLSLAVSKANDSAYQIGSKLAEASESLSASTHQFRITVSEETSGLTTLDDTLATNAREEAAVIDSQARVRASLDEYSRKVLEASASVEQMIRAISDIGLSAEDRQEGVDRLASLSRDGKKRVAELAQTIQTIVDATGHMDEVNSLIGDVAGRTNLLGMNASIEAAHAGNAGRGFAVVAQEIRTLSQQAESGSKSIDAILVDTRKAVSGATKTSQETSEFFSRMTEEIQRVADTLAELLGKLRELSAGTADVSKAIEGFSGLASTAGKEAEETGKSLGKTAEFSAASREVARTMRDDAQQMLTACDGLLEKAALVSELGRENIRATEELKSIVSSITISVA